MKLDDIGKTQLTEWLNDITEGCVGDFILVLTQALMQQLRDYKVDLEDTRNFFKEVGLDDETYIEHIYIKKQNLSQHPIHTFNTYHSHLRYITDEDWQELEDKLLKILDDLTYRMRTEIVYQMDTNKSVVVSLKERKVYEQIERADPTNNNRTLVLGAIPSDVTLHKNPLTDDVDRYDITWLCANTSMPLVQDGVSKMDIKDFLDEHNLILEGKKANDIINRMLFAMESEAEIKVDHKITTPGIYYNNIAHKIIANDLDIPCNPSIEEYTKALEFLEHYVETYFKGNEAKIMTVLKWGWLAPFGFLTKQLGYTPLWMFLYGRAGSGKTEGYGYPVLYMYGYPDPTKNDIGGSHIDTEARLSYRMKQGTHTILVNEPGNLFKKPATKDMIKNCILTKVSRAKYVSYTRYVNQPAYATMMFTSNEQPPIDPSLRRRIILIKLDYDEATTENMEQFREEIQPLKPLECKMNLLKPISSYVLERIQKEPELLGNWNLAMDVILTEIYNKTDRNRPEYITDWFEPETLENMDEDKTGLIHDYLHQQIIQTWTRIHKGETIGQTRLCNVVCDVIESQLIPWIKFKNQRKQDPYKEVAFNKSFANEINRLYEEEQSLKDIAELINFNFSKHIKCFGSRSGIHVSMDSLLKFLFPTDEHKYYEDWVYDDIIKIKPQKVENCSNDEKE